MLATTRKKPVIKISELTFDLEIINPIESKNLFGGCTYSSGWDCGCGSNWNENPAWDSGGMGFIGFSSSSNSGDSGGDSGGGGGWSSGNDWQQYDNNGDSNGDGILDADDLDNNGIKDADEPIYIRPYDQLKVMIEEQSNEANCVAYNMEYVNQLFTGQNQSAGYVNNVANYFANVFGQDMNVTGIVGANLGAVLNHYFITVQLTTNQQAIDAVNQGNPVIAAVRYSDGTGHAITIVGHDQATQGYIYVDTTTAQLLNSSIPGQGFANIEFAYEIKGVKP